MSSLHRVAPHNGKPYIKFHKAMDKNGNGVLKVFYVDGTTEIIRGSNAYGFPMHADKFYRSMSGLYGSK